MASKKHDVVISGFSGKFPSCANTEEFKEKLFSKSSLLTRDVKRWNPVERPQPYMTGKVPNADKFDISFFGIPSIIERHCDPVFGPLLENGFEAIFDSGVNPFSLKGRNVSVVAASSLTDAEMLRHIDAMFMDGAGVVGLSRAMLANRLSFFLGFTGPSYNLDASWVSAVQSLEIAADLIAKGRCEAAVVFAANLTFHNSIEDEYQGMGLLSLSETCSPFDAKADGFVRSEGSVAFFLQRREDARRNYCTLLGAEVRCLGSRDCSYTRIDNTLKTFLSDFYTNCGVDPGKVSYVEAFGLSEENYDTEELKALGDVFHPNIKNPLLIGSLTGNMGISECPSGFVSLVKAIIAMETGAIPPNINYNNPNPRVPALVDGRLKPVTELTSLNGDLVAVNSLNYSGNASHVLVKRHDKSKKPLSPGELPPDGLPRLVLLQARNEEGARAITDKLSAMPVIDVEFVSMVNDVFKVPTPAHLWRGYAVLPVQNKAVQNVQLFEPTKRPLWFVFSGMGSQWAGMGRDLLSIPAFSSAMDKCDAVLRPRGVDLKHIITHNDMKVFDDAVNSFVGITAIQLGLVDVLKTVGISADGLVGHSGGEVACGYADGCMTIEETILAGYYRGKAVMESDFKDINGLMAAVGMGYSTIKDHLPENIDVACHNASDSSTLSGPTDDILKYVEELKGQGVFAKIVDSAGIAYHSRTIRAVYPRLLKYLKEVLPNPKRRSTRWISSSVLQNQWDSEDAAFCSAEYMANNLTNPVYFDEACRFIPVNAIIVEIAPRGLLQSILRRSISPETFNVSLTNRTSESNVLNVLNALGKLHLNNVDMNINALYPTIDYPVSRGTPSLASLVTWDHDVSRYQEFQGLIKRMLHTGSSEAVENIGKDNSEYELWLDHLIDNQVALPTSQIMLYPWKMIFTTLRLDINQHVFILEDVRINDYVLVSDTNTPLFTAFSQGSLKFEVLLENNDSTSWTPVMSGRVKQPDSFSLTEPNALPPLKTSFKETVNEGDVYELFARFGYKLGPKFRNIKSVLIGESACLAKVQWSKCIVTFLDGLFKLVEYIQTRQQQRPLRPVAFTELIVNSEALHNIPLGSLLEVAYDFRSNILSCQHVKLHGLTMGPYTRKPPILQLKEFGLQRQYLNKTISKKENGSRGVVNRAIFNTSAIKPKMTSFGNLFTSEDPLLEIACVGLNTTTFTLCEGSANKECEVKYVDYAGLFNGQKVMGIGEINPQTNTLKLDTTLRWPVPADWTTEDAASVPLTYALAYTCIHLTGKVKTNENVLVHAGMSPIGQAIIRIAIDIGANIISTVDNENDATTLQNLFPSIKRNQIVVLSQRNLDVSLKIVTKGKGVDVAVNCFRGSKLQATARNMRIHSRFLNLSEILLEDREALGMAMFLKSNSFHAVTLDSILHSDEQSKSILQKFISDGIIKRTIKPLRRSTFNLKQENEALNHLNTIKEEKTLLVNGHIKPAVLQYSSEEVVIVVGTKTDLWLSTCEWLMKRGARKLVLLTEQKHFNSNNLRWLRKLMAQFKATVIFSSLDRSRDYTNAQTTLKDISCLGPVAAMFCVNMNENENPMKNLDSASRKVLPQLRQFVSLLGEGTSISQSRAMTGLPMTSVKFETTIHNPSMLLPYLTNILEENTCRASFFVVSDNTSTNQKPDDFKAETFLPQSVDSLSILGLQVQDKTSFFEVVTRSPGYQHVKHSLLPVFVIPSLGCESLEPLLRQLLHPAFCSYIPTCLETVEGFAEMLIENITNIQNNGPFNIVGDCWNGFVTLALGCVLEDRGHQVELFLLEGAPASSKDRVSALCKQYEGYLGASLLAATLGFLPGEVRKDDWNSQLEKALRKVPATIKETCTRALNSLYNQLIAVQQCDPPTQLFKGRVHLITCRDASLDVKKMSSMCQQSPTTLVTGDQNYQQLVTNPIVASYMNENLLFDWKL